MAKAPMTSGPEMFHQLRWVLHHVDELGKIGSVPGGGRTRLALTETDAQGRAYVKRLMEGAGLTVREDPLGNLFGRLEGEDPALPPVLIGSHIDTVPDAGAYDGCLGVLAAISTASRMARRRREAGMGPTRTLEVVAFTGEESSRFGLSLIGSRALAGTLDPGTLDRFRDSDGMSLKEALEGRGISPRQLGEMALHPGAYAAYVELHIDQGPFLAEQGCPIGIVTGIASPLRLRCVLRGEAVHSGAAPPGERKDALAAAARMLVEFESLAEKELSFQTALTVGHFRVYPNAVNVVPGKVEFIVDIRGIDDGSRRRLGRSVQKVVGEMASASRISAEVETLTADGPVMMDEGLRNLTARIAGREGVPTCTMPSMAAHDAMQMATVCPAGMILIRNESRVSHTPKEAAAPHDVAAGLRIMNGMIDELLYGD